ncbi:type IV pili methyl-accepting chemotaxis transducer N-terminal domain-containing protein [uncultured Hydrogenophaga sp.]|uniref:type IV pili methyl-accepting chemotaxis transducer N-terminal domain-containing protein n=1 Tax=uncultured Hydrogenophaga sp. TaxID=199683 RepID=UPI00265E0C5E|nr:type IV pili methyl-accepting chemotaxis transducer N-terminal domain-containing protein [uncultured Hydrogenophaga sp.]
MNLSDTPPVPPHLASEAPVAQAATPAPAPSTAPAHAAGLSLVNLAARQRMLSQRMILQTMLAAQGDPERQQAARRSLQIFTESQAHLEATPRRMEPAAARRIAGTYHGAQGVGPTIHAFIERVRTTLDRISEGNGRLAGRSLAELVQLTDPVLDALNTATTAFDEVGRAQSEAIMRELTGIVTDIAGIAREARVVSFNAQVVAARAGAHGREFAVVANVLTDITSEIDRLTRDAAVLADRSRRTA